jgi:hypothetical protein
VFRLTEEQTFRKELVVFGLTEEQTFRKELVVFRLTEGRLELRIISVYFCWVSVTHVSCTTLGRLELKWIRPKLSLCWYKIKRKCFLLFLDVICLKFLDQKSLLQLFLSCDTYVRFLSLPFHSQNKIIFYCHADWLSPVLHWSLFLLWEEDRCMGLTKNYSSHHNCTLKRQPS